MRRFGRYRALAILARRPRSRVFSFYGNALTMQLLKFMGGIGFTLFLVAGTGAACIYSGALDVAASTSHNAFEQSLFRTAMRRSVVAMSRSISQPPRFTDDMVKDGFDQYEHMCAGCHGGPGVERSEIGKGLNPQAPDLADAVPAWSPRQLFWIVKNGLKMTGMPSFGKTHDDKQVWSMVAFIEQLPGMSHRQYQEMKEQDGPTRPTVSSSVMPKGRR